MTTTTLSPWQTEILRWAVDRERPDASIFTVSDGIARFGPTGPQFATIALTTARALERKGLVTVAYRTRSYVTSHGRVRYLSDFVATLTPAGVAAAHAPSV